LETSPQKQKEQRQKQPDVSFSDVFSLPVHFEFFANFSYYLHFAKKISQIIKDYFCLPFFPLIILWVTMLVIRLTSKTS
jgi:hypothetical protein